MISRGLGTITITTAGTHVTMASVLAALGLSGLKVRKITFRHLLTNSHILYVGLSTTAPGVTTAMISSTGVNVVAQITPPAATGPQDRLVLSTAPLNDNGINVADFVLDAQHSGESFQI